MLTTAKPLLALQGKRQLNDFASSFSHPNL
jgi:hypothetical protein